MTPEALHNIVYYAMGVFATYYLAGACAPELLMACLWHALRVIDAQRAAGRS